MELVFMSGGRAVRGSGSTLSWVADPSSQTISLLQCSSAHLCPTRCRVGRMPPHGARLANGVLVFLALCDSMCLLEAACHVMQKFLLGF